MSLATSASYAGYAQTCCATSIADTISCGNATTSSRKRCFEDDDESTTPSKRPRTSPTTDSTLYSMLDMDDGWSCSEAILQPWRTYDAADTEYAGKNYWTNWENLMSDCGDSVGFLTNDECDAWGQPDTLASDNLFDFVSDSTDTEDETEDDMSVQEGSSEPIAPVQTKPPRTPWNLRRPGPSPLSQSYVPDDLPAPSDGLDEETSVQSPCEIPPAERSFAHRFLLQRAESWRQKDPSDINSAIRCTLADEDPKPALRGTPPRSVDDRERLEVLENHTYYAYTVDDAGAAYLGLRKMTKFYFRGHGGLPSELSSSVAERDMCGGMMSLSHQIDFDSWNGHQQFRIQADGSAVELWAKHAAATEALRLLDDKRITTGGLVYFTEHP